MRTYYLYVLSGTGHIQTRHDVETPDDEAAIAEAERLRDARGLELWCGARKVWACGARSQED